MRGSIRKRGANSWELQIELERVGSKRRRRFVTVRGGKKDAQRELAKLLASAGDGTLPDASRVTVAEYLKAWLAGALNLSPKTRERYDELVQHQIAPHLGDVKLQKLRPEHLEQWHSALIETGISARTVGHAHRVLSVALKRALENGSVSRNVAAVRRPPAVEEREVEMLIRLRPSLTRFVATACIQLRALQWRPA
jgi:Phage integrase, N-terminal SAM-like domain